MSIKTGERYESVFFGLWLTVHQLGVAFSGLLLGLELTGLTYDGAAPEQAPPPWRPCAALGFLPGLFLILAVIVLQRYGITRQAYLEIRHGAGPARQAAGLSGIIGSGCGINPI